MLVQTPKMLVAGAVANEIAHVASVLISRSGACPISQSNAESDWLGRQDTVFLSGGYGRKSRMTGSENQLNPSCLEHACPIGSDPRAFIRAAR